MCLLDYEFALQEVDGELIGTGFKLMHPENALEKGLWHRARNVDIYNKPFPPPQLTTEKSYWSPQKKRTYRAGFHVFLTEQAALNYQRDTYSYDWHLYKVSFKIVTSFGLNDTYNDNRREPCIVAEYLRYDEDLGSKENILSSKEVTND